jgi:hypothetical protein
MKKLMLAGLAGVAVMWFYDPASGSHRRESLQRTLNRGHDDRPAAGRLTDAGDVPTGASSSAEHMGAPMAAAR